MQLSRPWLTRMSPGMHRMAMSQDPLHATSEIHLMGCRRDGTLKTLSMRSRSSKTRGPAPNFEESPSLRDSQTSFPIGRKMKERFCAIEGGDKNGLEAVDICLVPNVGLPTDFKTLEFDKYKGSFCPHVHLAMFCRKMAAYIYDDKVLIHCFQDSLIEAALS
ncbi:hypothetical protein CR513_03715, partial [Mucuna pruriens]